MGLRDNNDFYRRHLPHYQPELAQYHVTARLAGSLPMSVICQMKEEYEKLIKAMDQTGGTRARSEAYHEAQLTYYRRFDSFLNSCGTGPSWLSNPQVASMVSEAIHFRDGKCFGVYCFCLMPNHMHLILDTATQQESVRQGPKRGTLKDMMASLKSYTAHEANKLLKRSGAFWQHESYDHVIRDSDELESLLRYVLNNPVKAGLVSSWEEWPWTYLREGLL